jgi:hypothetical protein
LSWRQGDQTERIFANLTIVYFGCLFKIFRRSAIFGYLFPWYKLCINFDKKTAWAKFWAIFSETHLVTLLRVHFFNAEQSLCGVSKLTEKIGKMGQNRKPFSRVTRCFFVKNRTESTPSRFFPIEWITFL